MAPFLDSLAREDLAPATLRGHHESSSISMRIRRWRAEGPSATQRRDLDRLEEQNRRLRQVTTEVLALAAELRKGTIDRIMAMSDLELGLQALLGTLPPPRS